MPKRKAAVHCNILPWLSARLDRSEGRFIQIGNSLLLSHKNTDGEEQNAFVKLSTGAKHLYFCMAMECGGKRQFLFPQKAAEKYSIAPASFRRYIDELLAAGMVKRRSGKTARLPNEYEFVFDWKRPP